MAVNTAARPRTRPRRAAAGYPVLASKIIAPALPGWVISRPRLTERIAGGAAGPLTTVTGPPGAGKTIALASWAAAGTAPGRVAWVTLDDLDNQPGSFWSHVVAALRQAGVAVPGGLRALCRGRAIDHGLLLELASVLAAHDPPLVLVLDDLHLITAPGPVQELATVLRYAQPGLHVIAAARADPLLPLHRYRVAGELTEIRAAELSFPVPEAAQLMAQHGISLPAEMLELITRRVEGWAAGLRLAALSLDHHPDPALFIKNLTAEDNAITGYLVAEVLDAQPAATRDLMLRTSILDQVSADLACELTGDPQAAGTLAALARSNVFVQSIGGGWYRYHCLLAAVMRLMLRRESPGRVPGLHQRAARWYQQHGLPGEAIAHAAQISDWPLAAQIVIDELAIGDLLEPGGNSPLADRLRQIPGPPPLPDGPARPQPLLATAALHLSDGRDQACARPARCRRTAARPAPGRPGDHLQAGRRPHPCHRRPPVGGPRLRTGRGRQGPSAVRSATGRPADGPPADARAGPFRPRHRRVVVRRPGRGDRSLPRRRGRRTARQPRAGDLPRAPRPDRGAGRPSEPGGRAGRRGDDAPGRAPVSSAAVALALVHLQRHEPAAWQRRLNLADTALRAHPDRLIGALACLVAACGAVAQTRGPAAADLLRRARHGWSPPPWLDHLLTVAESRASAVAGDVQAALDAARRARTEAALDACVALARAWLAAGNIQAARQALGSAADDPPDIGIRLQVHLTDALISYHSGNPAQARRSLSAPCASASQKATGSPSSRTGHGSGTRCETTRTWPAPTAGSSCPDNRPAATSPRARPAPRPQPRQSPSSSATANARSSSACHQCSAPQKSPANCTSPSTPSKPTCGTSTANSEQNDEARPSAAPGNWNSSKPALRTDRARAWRGYPATTQTTIPLSC